MWMKVRVAGYVGLLFAVLVLAPEATAQTNTFSLQADPSSVEVAPGGSIPVTISSAVVSGEAETISFQASGAPAHVTVSFDPTSVLAGSSTTLTISADSGAVLGTTATITAQGTAPSDTETTTVALRIASYVSMDEWNALSSLYSSTVGSGWTTSTGWDFSGTGPNGTECSWYGIQCDATPHVTAIDLPNNNLTGTLPDLSGLSGMIEFDVTGNGLTGSLPASIQNMTALAQIDVSSNQLGGTLDVLDGMSNLQQFQGDKNEFTGMLPQLGSMPNLLGFSVEGNQLTGSMPSLAQSTKLVYLDVSSNYLTGSVPSLDALQNLRYLYISANRLTGAMPPPPMPINLAVAFLCPNFFAPIANSQWDGITHTRPWYLNCNTDTLFANGFGLPPSMQ